MPGTWPCFANILAAKLLLDRNHSICVGFKLYGAPCMKDEEDDDEEVDEEDEDEEEEEDDDEEEGTKGFSRLLARSMESILGELCCWYWN